MLFNPTMITQPPILLALRKKNNDYFGNMKFDTMRLEIIRNPRYHQGII